MCNLYAITTDQAAIAALFRVVNSYVGNLPPMPGVFPDYPAPVVRNAGAEREPTIMRWGMPPPLRTGVPVTNIRAEVRVTFPLDFQGGRALFVPGPRGLISSRSPLPCYTERQSGD